MNIDPYVMGEAAAWGEDYNGDSLGRLYGSAGIRGSLQFFKALPDYRDPIFGLNGLAHKSQIDFDYYFAQATESLSDVPQYNEFDEDAQDRFRERVYSARIRRRPAAGIRSAVLCRAVRSRTRRRRSLFRTRRRPARSPARMAEPVADEVGPPDRPRIKDWMIFDLEATVFPNADRDNFGETLGLINGRYIWNVGERTSLLASGIFDVSRRGPTDLECRRPRRSAVLEAACMSVTGRSTSDRSKASSSPEAIPIA